MIKGIIRFFELLFLYLFWAIFCVIIAIAIMLTICIAPVIFIIGGLGFLIDETVNSIKKSLKRK